jgi:hypothetical protein
MNQLLKDLAFQYLTEELPVKRFGILLKVENLLKDYNYKSRSRFLKDFQLSYFASVNSSQKIEKGKKENYDTLILYLSAGKNAGKDLCTFASTGCRLACLVESGHALLEKRAGKAKIAIARMIKSWVAIYRKDICDALLCHEIKLAKKNAEKNGRKFSVRLNGTSDIEFYDVINTFPDIQFYDYTKDPDRIELPNYHLTFSYSNQAKSRFDHYKQALSRDQSIAFPVVSTDFDQACELSDCYNMDETDLRFLDKTGKYGILKAKLTDNLTEGVKQGFILTLSELKKVINKIES